MVGNADESGVTQRWEAMSEHELARVVAISIQIHHALPERPECLDEKRRLFPEGAFVLRESDAVLGYAFAHPWLSRSVPLLNEPLGLLPSGADALHLHDIAILPEARGRSATSKLMATLSGIALRRRLKCMTLVSVYGTEKLWGRMGFVKVTDPTLEQALETYGENALYMMRDTAWRKTADSTKTPDSR
jgi:GNAT superfamily N-acetyltransferase